MRGGILCLSVRCQVAVWGVCATYCGVSQLALCGKSTRLLRDPHSTPSRGLSSLCCVYAERRRRYVDGSVQCPGSAGHKHFGGKFNSALTKTLCHHIQCTIVRIASVDGIVPTTGFSSPRNEPSGHLYLPGRFTGWQFPAKYGLVLHVWRSRQLNI